MPPIMRSILLLACSGIRVADAATARIALSGYLCATCPSTPHPVATVAALPAAFTRVIFAFAGWDAHGNILNQWDGQGLTLTRAVVSSLQAQGRTVLISLGGGAGAPLVGPPPPGFAAAVVRGLAALVTSTGLDGVDLDIENFQGDAVSAMLAVRDIVTGLRAAVHPTPLLVTCAPQMTDVYPDYTQETAGFNRFAPLLGADFLPQIDAIQPQMYNSWSGVESIAYARTYVSELVAGFVVVSGAGPSPVNITIPAAKLWLGYPASRSAAGSGFIDPQAVVAMVRSLAANGTAIGGLMTWDIGWDEQNKWEFANAVAGGVVLPALEPASARAPAPMLASPSPTPLPIPVLGPVEVVVDWASSHCTCAQSPGCTDPHDPDYPDTPPRVFVDGAGVAHLFATDAQSRVSLLDPGASAWRHNCTVQAASAFNCAPSGYNFQTWLHSPYALDNDTVVALTHMEYHGWSCANESFCTHSNGGDCANEAVQAWTSHNGGWDYTPEAGGAPHNLVAVSPFTYEYARDTWNASELGFGDPSTIFRGPGGAYYVYISASNPPIGINNYSGPQQRGQCLSRTSDLRDWTAWRAWDGAAFSTTFVDPYAAPVANTSAHVCQVLDLPFIFVNVGWSAYFGAYLASGFGSFTYSNGTHIPCCGAWQYSLSDDLFSWRAPQIIRPCAQEGRPGGDGTWEYDGVFLDDGTPWLRNWHEDTRESLSLFFWRSDGPGRSVLRQPVLAWDAAAL